MVKIIILVLSITLLNAPVKESGGVLERCFGKNCLEVAVFDLKKDDKIFFSSYMEDRRYKNKLIGRWSQIDSVIAFNFNNFNSSKYTSKYYIKKIDSLSFLIGENEINEWLATKNKIISEVELDEDIILFRSFKFKGVMTEEDLAKEKKMLLKFKITAVKRAISDMNIFIKVE
jgi:hypothetical protein